MAKKRATIACSCGRMTMTGECQRCRQHRLMSRKVKETCRVCGKECPITIRAFLDGKRQGRLPICGACRRRMSSSRFVAMHARRSKKERVAMAKAARARVETHSSEIVRKQWNTIRANPEKWAKAKARLKRLSQIQWKTMSDEERDRRVQALAGAHGKGRSKLNDELVRLMQERGVYDGFVSEESFHGFIPDEINHALKIIVELYGEVYHCDPRKYKDRSQYVSTVQRTVGEQWDRDRRRLAAFYRNGYSVVIVWERDFRRNPENEIRRIADEIDKKRNASRPV